MGNIGCVVILMGGGVVNLFLQSNKMIGHMGMWVLMLLLFRHNTKMHNCST